MDRAESDAYRLVSITIDRWAAHGLPLEQLGHALTAHGLALLSEIDGPDVWADQLEDLALAVRQMPGAAGAPLAS